jgi:hypothetical protein
MLNHPGITARQTTHLEVSTWPGWSDQSRLHQAGFKANAWLSHQSQRRDSTRVKRGERAFDSEPGHAAVNGSGDAPSGRNMRAMSMAISSDCS